MHAARTGVEWVKRDYKPGEAEATGDPVNRLLSAANTALYGVCHAVICGLGANPALGFVHTGFSTAFVTDMADLYKAEFTIPLAFDLARQGLDGEREARTAFRQKLTDGQFMARIVDDVITLLRIDGKDFDAVGENRLWDDKLGSVEGGVNWSLSTDAFDYLAITGPELMEEL
jgi:CRISPR-associated protein Cas1